MLRTITSSRGLSDCRILRKPGVMGAGSASHIVAVSAHEVRSVRAVARRPVGGRWSREVPQGL
eukprot:8574363-Alexandrium_andersonii.AAC.1